MVIRSNLATENTILQRNHDVLQQAHATLQLNSSSMQQSNASLLRELDVVRVELANTCDDLGSTRHRLNSAEDEIDHLHDSKHDKQTTISDLNEQVDLLKNQLHDLEHEHSSCHHKQPRLTPDSPTPCRADSPMVEDSAAHPQVVPSLLSRMADPPQAISPVSTLPIVAPSTPLNGHALPVVAPFTPLPGDTSLAPLAPLMAPHFAVSQFYDSVGLYSLHPILSYTSNQYFCTALAGDGDIDFASHALFVYAFGDCNAVGPAWTTYLVTREQLTDELRAPALAANLPLLLIYIAGGGGTVSLYHHIKIRSLRKRLTPSSVRITRLLGTVNVSITCLPNCAIHSINAPLIAGWKPMMGTLLDGAHLSAMNRRPMTKIWSGNDGSNSNAKRMLHLSTLVSHTSVRDIKPYTSMARRPSFALSLVHQKDLKGPLTLLSKMHSFVQQPHCSSSQSVINISSSSWV